MAFSSHRSLLAPSLGKLDSNIASSPLRSGACGSPMPRDAGRHGQAYAELPLASVAKPNK